MKQFKVGDKVKLSPESGYYKGYYSSNQLAPNEVGIIREIGEYGWLRVNNLHGEPVNSYEEHDLLLVEETPEETEVDLIPTHIAEYIEHLELREEALEQLVSSLYQDLSNTLVREEHLVYENESKDKALDNFSRLTSFISSHPSVARYLNARIGDDVVDVLIKHLMGR